MEETMLRLNAFSNNHHPSRVKMLAKYIRRGISVILNHEGDPWVALMLLFDTIVQNKFKEKFYASFLKLP
jgi:hypothetical protein